MNHADKWADHRMQNADKRADMAQLSAKRSAFVRICPVFVLIRQHSAPIVTNQNKSKDLCSPNIVLLIWFLFVSVGNVDLRVDVGPPRLLRL
jgi:hypothetical protein